VGREVKGGKGEEDSGGEGRGGGGEGGEGKGREGRTPPIFYCTSSSSFLEIYLKPSDNRSRLEVDNTFSMIAKADDAGFIKLLLTFAAANLDRLPHLKTRGSLTSVFWQK